MKMKNYNYFILEKNNNDRIDTTTLQENDFNFLLKKYCTQFDFSDKPIYRGVELESDYYKIDPKLYTRKSRNTSNYYTLLMSKWENIPARNKSIICSFDKNMTIAYGKGNIFRVIPFDNSSWGVSMVWIKIIYDFFLMVFNDDLYYFMKENNIKLNDINYNEFMEQLQKFTGDNFLEYLKRNDKRTYTKIKSKINGKRLDIGLKELIVPNDNIKTYSYNELLLSNGKELWTDSTCLLQKIK